MRNPNTSKTPMKKHVKIPQNMILQDMIDRQYC